MKNPVPGIQRTALLLAAALAVSTLGACTPAVEKLWEYPISSPIYSTPLVAGDLVIFGSESGTLHAVDKNGHARWTFQVPSAEIFSHPQTDGKLIFFGATNQKFYAVDMSGQGKWQYAASERIKSDLTIVEGVAYGTSYDGHVYALQASNGRKLWQFPPAVKKVKKEEEGEKKEEEKKEEEEKPEVAPPPLDPMPQAFSYAKPVVKDGVIYVGNLDGYLYAIQTSDGALKWRRKVSEGITSTAWVEGGTVYFGSKDDAVYALDAATGEKEVWKFQTQGDVLSSPRIADGVLFIGSNDKNFYALDAKTGKEKCHFTAKGPIISYGVFYKNLVFFGAGQGDGNLYAIDQASCTLFYSFKTGYKIESDPFLDGDRLYLTSGDKKLYAFKINKTE